MDYYHCWDFADDFFESKLDDKGKALMTVLLATKIRENPYYPAFWEQEFNLDPLDKLRMKPMEGLYPVECYPRSRKELAECELSEICGRQVAILYFLEAWLKGFDSKRWARLIRAAKQYVEKFPILSEYIPGIMYLRRWALLEIYVMKEKLPPKSNPDDYNGEKEFDELPKLSQAIILVAKSFYLSAFRPIPQAWAGSKDVMTKVVSLDPTSFEWHYLLGNWVRNRRRSSGFGPETYLPTNEELQIFWETYNEEREKNRVNEKDSTTKPSDTYRMALSGLTQAVAELLKHRSKHGAPYYPIEIGDLLFHSDDEMLEFIMGNINKMTSAWDSPCFAQLVRSGEILSNILPPPLRDYPTAEKYYLQAVKLWPTNSKGFHKLGSIYLCDELQDKEKAIKYLSQAVELEINNFPATMDLINVLLSDPEKNEEALNALINTRVEHFKSSARDQAQLQFASGCLKFMRQQQGAAWDWIKAHSNQDGQYDYDYTFQRLKGVSKRFRWNIDLVSVLDIRSYLDHFARTTSTLTEEEKKTLSNMMEQLPSQVPQKRGNYGAPPVLISDADDDWRSSTSRLPETATASNGHVPLHPYKRKAENRARSDTSPKKMDSDTVKTTSKYIPPHRRH